jgi:tetratricopeptide (TPR) repeat protein
MLIKQDAATLPLAAIALVWLVWPRDREIRQRVTISIVLLLVLAATLVVFRSSMQSIADVARQNTGLVRGGSEPTLDFVPYMLTSVKEWVFYYLWRLFLPFHLNVDPQSIPILHPATPSVLIASGVIAVLMLLGWTFGKRDRLMAAAFTLILVSPLAAYCAFPLADVVAEHRAYITVAGAVMLVAATCSKFQKRQVVLILLLASYSALSVARNSVWMDNITLWEDASRKGPDNLRPHINLGLEYEARGRNDLAISHYKFVLARNNEHPAVLTNLSSLYLSQNDIQSAERLLSPVVQKNVQFAPLYVNLAAVRIQQRDFQNAFVLLDRAKEINPRQVNVSYSRGVIYGNMDRPDLAIPEYLQELDLDPTSNSARLDLGRAYEAIGEREKAISCYQTVLRADPSNAQALQGLARTAASKLQR